MDKKKFLLVLFFTIFLFSISLSVAFADEGDIPIVNYEYFYEIQNDTIVIIVNDDVVDFDYGYIEVEGETYLLNRLSSVLFTPSMLKNKLTDFSITVFDENDYLVGQAQINNFTYYHSENGMFTEIPESLFETEILLIAPDSINALNGIDVLKDLKRAVLTRNEFYDLSPISSLENLELLWYQCNVKDITPLQNLTNLKSLKMGDFGKVNSYEPLSYLENLERIEIFNLLIEIEPIMELKNLKSLFFMGIIIDPENIIAFLDLPDLYRLRLDLSGIEDFSFISEFTQLKKLSLGGNDLSDISMIKDLTNLKDLYLEGNNIQDISPIENLINLERLELGYNQIQNLEPLANLTELSLVGLSQNQIQDLSPLANLTNLKQIVLDSNQIVDISPLQNLENLELLILNDTLVKDFSVLDYLDNTHIIR